MVRCVLTTLASCATLTFAALASEIIAPAEMQQRMGVGINLGNRIDLWQQDAREVKEEFFDEFKNRNFTNVRIPVCWHMRTQETAPYTIDESFLSSVEEMVDWSLQRGMVTVLNTHHEKWLDEPSAFEAGLPRLEAMWTQIAERFASKDQLLLFEIFNEAHLMSTDQLNTMNAAILPIIRNTNPTRIVFIQGLKFGNPSWIIANPSGLVIPNDPQIMLEIHNYDPFKYAGSNPTQLSWGSSSDRNALDTWMTDIDAWSKANGLPIYYGEFGITNTQTHETGRDEWLMAHYDGITSRGWAASVWNDGGGHLVFNYNDNSWVDDILRDLGRVAPPSPPPAPTPPPPPSPPIGSCCYGASSCTAATNCPSADEKPFCNIDQDHCESHCGGLWCSSSVI